MLSFVKDTTWRAPIYQKAKMLSSTFWHVLAESILLVALGQTIAFCEAKMLCLKANLLRAKALFSKVNLLLTKALLRKAALLDWSAPGLTPAFNLTCAKIDFLEFIFSNIECEVLN